MQILSHSSREVNDSYKYAILFDLDGTLVDSAPDLVAAGLNSLITHNIISRDHPINFDNTIYAFTGAGSRFFLDKVLEMLNIRVSENTMQKIQEDFIAYYFKHIDVYSKPYDGAENLLKKLKKDGFGLAICTNKTEILTLNLLQRLDIHQYFDIVIGADTLDKPKPAPDCILHCANFFNLPTSRLIMIGDSYKDMKAAFTAGAGRIAAAYGYCYDDFSQYHVYTNISSLAEAYDAIHAYYQEMI